jgi:hypothetical protein
MTTATGKHTFEIEVTLTGTFTPAQAERGPSYSSGGEPAEPASAQDIEIVGIAGLTTKWTDMGIKWTPTDLMTGVDFRNPEVQKLLANMINFMGDDAVQAIVDGAAE